MSNKGKLVLVAILFGLSLAFTLALVRPTKTAQAVAPTHIAHSGVRMMTTEVNTVTLSYQGQMLDDQGVAYTDPITMWFELYTAPDSGATFLGASPAVVVEPNQQGIFTTLIDFDRSIFHWSCDLWLELNVLGDPGPLWPRLPIVPVPYAYELVPGAYSLGSLPDEPILTAYNMNGVGLMGRSDQGVGVYAHTRSGHALVTEGPSLLDRPTLQQIAQLRWYDAISTTHTFTVGGSLEPSDIVFDGDYLWIANRGGDLVKMRASDGKIVTTQNTGGIYSVGVAHDGKYVWVANAGSDTVSRFLASDPTQRDVYTVGDGPVGITFDGSYVWVTSEFDDTVWRIDASNPAISTTIPVGGGPRDVAFDGEYIWVSNTDDDTLTKIKVSDPSISSTYVVGDAPRGLVFDGAYMWVVNSGAASVTRIRGLYSTAVFTDGIGNGPWDIVFDGAYVWISNRGDNTISRLRAYDGSPAGVYPVGNSPAGMAFDGAHIWVCNYDDDTLSKR